MIEHVQSSEKEAAAGPSFVEAGGHRLEYVWLGPGPSEAPTLVFLHEGLGSVAMWKDYPAALASATGCGALIYSRRGYGRSEPIRGPRPVTYMHDEARQILPELLARLGVRDPILVGHSDGGSIALVYAGYWVGYFAGYRAGHWAGRAPDTRVIRAPAPRALVLEAPHVFVEEHSLEGIARAKEAYRASPDLRRKLSHYHDDVDGAFWGWNDVWLNPDFARWNIQDYLGSVTCPVLVVQGEDDEYGTRKQVETIAAGVAGPTEVEMLPDCGHAPHHESRETSLSSMTGFIRRILGRDRADA